ncbi:MAG: AAA family ATPase [Candidatus Parcubacteria bacterium]|nr:AAA family ATPase [Candidatus Parcubacteria bacterium]
MYIKEVNIENFKCFKGKFNLKLNEGLNILVGDNEAGKSTILEAIHLALSGLFNGRYLKNELTQYLFNNEVVAEYVEKLSKGESATLPHILIEVFVVGDDLAKFEGDSNSEGKKECGISLKIAFDDKYQKEYEEFIKGGSIKTIPIEYYDVFWTSCARENITARSIPIKSALIDSSSNRYQNGSDIYISRIVKDFLEPEDIVSISQAHRKMRDVFMDDTAIQNINSKIKTATKISSKDVRLSVDLSSKNAWENSLMTYFDNVPFHHIGKGEQCIVKTNLALSHNKSQEANILLLEEPENHLSHTKLNQLIHGIKSGDNDKQIIISTHSSFVANKLGLKSLILLNNNETVKLDDLQEGTKSFFERLSGYDTLRLILCQKAILVEGDSDELIIQKVFRINNDDKLPIESGVDVISVGTSFLRFLEIAQKIKKPVVVVTDNDGNPVALKQKYNDYLGVNIKDHIKICFDESVDTGNLKIDEKKFNYNTLEPKLLKVNSLESFNKIFGTTYTDIDDLHKYMKANKTDCALKIFDTTEILNFPEYILEAIK